MSWKEWVDESVEFYNGRIKELNQKLGDKGLSVEQRSAMESEKKIIVEERTKWKIIQNTLS